MLTVSSRSPRSNSLTTASCRSTRNVEVDTGWVRMESGADGGSGSAHRLRISRSSGSTITRSRCRRYSAPIMASYHGELRTEFGPAFDTLKIDIHMSEPNYELGIDKERISSLEALQEDTFYSTENFVNMMGDLLAGRPVPVRGSHHPDRARVRRRQGCPRPYRVLREARGRAAGRVALDRSAGQPA